MKRDRIVRTIFCVVLVLCVCVCCVLLYVSATTKTVYVDSVYGADTNDGTGTKPYKTLDRAISSAGSSDTKIVLKSNITISGDYAEPEHTGNITITSSSGKTITFTNSTGAEFTTYRLNGPTTFESVSIKLSDYHIFAAQHNPIVFGSGVSVTNGSKYAFVVGGYQTPDSTVQTDLDSSIRIDSGSFYKICGFTRTKGEAGLTFTGTASITINGGSVSDIYGASLYNHYSGSAVITVNGGTITNIYAGGDVTRRLNGAAVVTLNGGKVTKIDINNVVGDATLNLVGACPSAVSVSYASDTIKTLAEKAGSVKSANYNALVCTDSIVSSLVSQFDVVTNNAVVYVGGDGTGDGSSADSPMSSFADAYGKIAAYGGTLYVVGETYADKAILDAAYSEPVSIVGYSSDSRLVLSDGYTLT